MQISLLMNGVDKLVANNKAFSKRMPSTVLNAMRTQLRRTLSTVKLEIRAGGIGRTIWGDNGKGLDKIVTLIKSRIAGDDIETGIRLRGIPVLIEEGGRIAPHFIKNGFGLKGNRIPHPGNAITGHRFARRALDRDGSLVVSSVVNALQKLQRQTWAAA